MDVQTFMPYGDFYRVATCLDDKRLGKQRVEARQILNTGPDSRWWNHPAVRMWQGYDDALKLYTNMMIDEWVRRGFRNNMVKHDIDLFTMKKPPWVHDTRVHFSHRANLLRKDVNFYSLYGWHHQVDPYEGYYWPVEPRTERSREINEYWTRHPLCI